MGGGGFNAVPEELQRAANVITDTVGQAAKLVWQGPSGNYGHPGVQGGWDQFVADAKAEINRLAQAAKGHGESLNDAARDYRESDQRVVDLLNQIIGGGTSAGGRIDGLLGTSGPSRSDIGNGARA
ncbi:hypothetical protein GCM10025787_00190 [Saccharopolyspora rosea]|uniref:WXG100 family type VII secretion target n=1 Tax=Saccharopolyspora rosea TaxID=524884 RepID=A0ABW3FSW9_9PSEU